MWLLWTIAICFGVFIAACVAGWFYERLEPQVSGDQTGDNWEIEYDSEKDKYFITASKYFIKARLNWGETKHGWTEAKDAHKFAEEFLAKRCEKEELAKQRGQLWKKDISAKIDKSKISQQVSLALGQQRIAEMLEECRQMAHENAGFVDEKTQQLVSENEKTLEQMRVSFQAPPETEKKTAKRARARA